MAWRRVESYLPVWLLSNENTRLGASEETPLLPCTQACAPSSKHPNERSAGAWRRKSPPSQQPFQHGGFEVPSPTAWDTESLPRRAMRSRRRSCSRPETTKRFIPLQSGTAISIRNDLSTLQILTFAKRIDAICPLMRRTHDHSPGMSGLELLLVGRQPPFQERM